jgi:hypothetical protein
MPEILGVGEHLMHAVVNGEVNYSMAFLVILAIVKLLTVGLSEAGWIRWGDFCADALRRDYAGQRLWASD